MVSGLVCRWYGSSVIQTTQRRCFETTLSIEQAKKEINRLECLELALALRRMGQQVRALGEDLDQGQGEPTVRPRGHRKGKALKHAQSASPSTSPSRRGAVDVRLYSPFGNTMSARLK